MVKAKKFLYVKRFDGEPKNSDFQLVDEDLPDIKDGGNNNYIGSTQIHLYFFCVKIYICLGFQIYLCLERHTINILLCY